MPIFATRQPAYRPNRQLTFDWDNFRGGLNTLFKESELANNELAQAENLMLIGRGVPTKRWGTDVYFLSGATGSVRGLAGFYQKDGTNQLLAINDDGLLTKKSNASYSTLTGVSWASGNNVEMTQIDDKMYIVNGQRELARYSNPTLVGFTTIDPPSNVFATQWSGASGTNTMSYRMTAVSKVGETAPTDPVLVANQPLDLTDGAIKLSWTAPSVASGERVAFNIYGRTEGDETFLATVDGEATEWLDDGSSIPQLFAYPPIADSTGGPIAKYIKRFKDRLVLAGIKDDPTMVLISGRQPNHEKFDFGSGGGFVRIEPDSGDEITGLEVKGDNILVFKEKSIWRVSIDTVQIGNFYLIEPTYELITRSVGCASQRSIVHVENDILFLAKGGKGIFVVGHEPGIIGDILRTNEISVKVRPYFQNLTPEQEENACAVYYNYRYIISFPGRNESMVFDRERTAWMGPWTFDARIFEVYYDENDQARLIYGKDDEPQVNEISSSFAGDEGSPIKTILRTGREDFGSWTDYKDIKNILTLWRNLSGSVNVDIRLEQQTGNTITAKSFSVTTGAGNSGWGADLWANAQWGDTEVAGEARDLSEIVREVYLQKSARNVQLMIKTENLDDKYELMRIKGEAEILPSFRPSDWRV